MSGEGAHSSIADSSKPNAGRIYDFLLGGSHNFEVDRLAAQRLLQVAPFLPKLVRVIRWFLGEAVHRLTEAGYTRFIDFASGLPTIDHIHHIAPPGTNVIYSDIDPVTVAYGQQIIKDNPNVRYVSCDAVKPEGLLSSPIVSELFGKNREVAIGFNGIAYFLSDDSIRHALGVLHEWAAPKSRLFLCDFDAAVPTPAIETILKLYEQLGQPGYRRTRAVLEDIIHPWKVIEPGFMLLEDWISMKQEVAEDTKSSFGGVLNGVILEK
jgi:hypothetical protein